MNEIASENDLLKLAIGKARYGVPLFASSTFNDEMAKIDLLQMENEELKTVVNVVS